MAEKGDKFWLSSAFNLRDFESEWEKTRKNKDIDYSMNGELSQRVESNIGNRVVLVGPMVDGYLLQIEKAMMGKLERGNLTGLVPPVSIYVPWDVMKHVCSMLTSYGVVLKVVNKDKKKKKSELKKIVMFLETQETSEKVVNPARFDGTNYLGKRKYSKQPNPESKKYELQYNGEARVVVSKYTPIRFDYESKNNCLRVNFYVQRYTKENFVVDTSLQKLMNTDAEVDENRIMDEDEDL